LFRSGTVGIVGRPNVGKSTLLNLLVGEKIAAVTDKPQTTRHRILGIRNLKEGQILFVDSPGIHKPHKGLNAQMVETARQVLFDADLLLFVTEARETIVPADRQILSMIRRTPFILVLNKIDLISSERLLGVIELYRREFNTEEIFPISARRGKGVERLLNLVVQRLPEGAAGYPEDQLTDATERFLASEVIREKATLLTYEEVPYSLAVVIEEYREPREEDSKKLVRIRASIVVEKESQKAILIGKGGEKIKKIGIEARKELEGRLGQQVFLELFVRVDPGWTEDPQKVREHLS